jgi:flagellum-specific peptidoglycan hydrolase FlgJ
MRTFIQFLDEATSAQQAFYNDVRARAKRQGASDIDADVIASQSALETGWGKSPSGKNNYFGQKASSKEAGTTKGTWEVQGGKNITTSAKFKDYDDLDSSIKDRMSKWSYKTKGAKDVEDAARRLQLPGGAKIPGSKEKSHGAYATDPDYVSKVSSIARRYGSGATASGVMSAAKPTPTPAAKPTKGSLDTPTQTRVLAKLKGKTGEVDKTTGKFSQRDWSQPEGSRYKAFGGK